MPFHKTSNEIIALLTVLNARSAASPARSPLLWLSGWKRRGASNMTTSYTVTFVHPIAGSCPDATIKCNTIPDGAFSNRQTLGKALRDRGIMFSGQAVRNFRVEGNKTVVFPDRAPGGWYSITLTAEVK
jgi:hypothetical protein